MRHAIRSCRALLVGFGITVAMGGAAWSYSPADLARQSIVQSVRDDVRRRINTGEANPMDTRPEIGTVGQASSRTYRSRKPKNQLN